MTTKPETRHEWAVRVHCDLRGQPGPHILECADRMSADIRLAWWRRHRAYTQPELLHRTVTVTTGPWETA